MDWYYARGQDRVGPVSESDLRTIVDEGGITPETLVWHSGLADWQPYGEVATEAVAGATAAAAPAGSFACVECGRLFSTEEMVRFRDVWVCAMCKPVFFQRLQEGAPLPGQLVYAGFWIRFGAKFIDNIIVGIPSFVVQLALGAVSASGADPVLAFVLWLLGVLSGYAIGATYTTWFLGRFGATPGKMACGLKVVRPDGGQVTYWRAFGRYFAEMLSGLVLMIGYIMAAFDDEKRTLHDRICDTRVVKKEASGA